MARRRNKGPEEKKGGGESGSGRWMLTYLDMVTLLFGVFVVMYAMSQVDQKKFEEVAASLKLGFQGGGKSLFLDRMIGGKTILEKLQPPGTRIKSEFQKISDVINKEMQENNMYVHEDERGFVITLAADIFFESGTARLTEEARNVLDKLAPVLSEIRNSMRVEGYTDDLALTMSDFSGESGYQDNWELGAMRAINVVRHLEYRGVEAKKLSAQTFGENLPIIKRDMLPDDASPERRALNRRVDIVIIRNPNTVK
jgi:chemotaxis protein MotB